MLKRFLDNLYESFMTIYPIMITVILIFLFIPFNLNLMMSFIYSSVLLILGTSLFTFGAELSLVNIGQRIGTRIVNSKKLWLVLIVSLILGTILTIAEPDLRVLAEQVTSIPSNILIVIISGGVGIFMLIAALRSIYGFDLNNILLISYIIIGLLTLYAPADIIPFAYDSGGVTTGTISIPFIVTLGVGLVASRTDKKAKEDQFGLVALCSTGPILIVLLISILFKITPSYDINEFLHDSISFGTYIENFIIAIKDTLFSTLPVILVSIVYILITRELKKSQLKTIFFGFFYVVIGLVLFLLSVNVGFMEVAMYIGKSFSLTAHPWVLFPIIMFIAYFIAIAEPAVKVIVDKIELLTGGTVEKKHISTAIAIGVSLAAMISLIRIQTHTPFVYYAFPFYALALILMFFIPKYFTAIAFDVGGATGGTLTTAFILPMLIGACEVYHGNVLTDAFGLAALTSLIPIVTVEIVGILYSIRIKSKERVKLLDDTIISFEGDN